MQKRQNYKGNIKKEENESDVLTQIRRWEGEKCLYEQHFLNSIFFSFFFLSRKASAFKHFFGIKLSASKHIGAHNDNVIL